MKVLVTGARGFLGRQVVLALRARGHPVRALERPRPSSNTRPAPLDGVEEFHADLCTSPDLAEACRDVRAVVHLAAQLRGDEASVVRSAVDGTQRLLDGMQRSGVKRLVLASSLSVYDWNVAEPELNEESPLESRPETRDAYTTAKLRQEALARELCRGAGIALTVLRPPVIWGAGREVPPTLGQRIGPLHVVFDPDRQLPSVHLENCADAFAHALDLKPETAGTFNVVDHPEITARRFVQDHLRRSRRFGLVIPAGYSFTLASLRALDRLAPGPLAKRLPSFCAPARFIARYRPVRITGAKFRDELGWRPPLTYEQCLDRTYER